MIASGMVASAIIPIGAAVSARSVVAAGMMIAPCIAAVIMLGSVIVVCAVAAPAVVSGCDGASDHACGGGNGEQSRSCC